jgi:hypothetical protein
MADAKTLMFLSRTGPAFEPTDYQQDLAKAKSGIAYWIGRFLVATTGEPMNDGRREFCQRLAERALTAVDPDALVERGRESAFDFARELAATGHCDEARVRLLATEVIACYEGDLHRAVV